MSKTVVHTSSGLVQGAQEGTVVSWKGIPFAQPPVGVLRFRPPQPPQSWFGIYAATAFGAMAMQPPRMPAELLRRLSMSEDCLTLNIWSPGADEQLRPVLVWWPEPPAEQVERSPLSSAERVPLCTPRGVAVA
jgi:para-nitrobenzyl esterase